MTWLKLPDTFNDDPDLLALPRGVRLFHVEALSWSCKHERDGEVPRGLVRRITDEPDVDDAVAQLVAAGLWEETDTGWRLIHYQEHQQTSEEITARRAVTAARQERFRRHSHGDHSTCDPKYCKTIASRNGVSNGVTNGVSNAPPSRPVPSRPKGREGKGIGAGPAKPAALPGGRSASYAGPLGLASVPVPQLGDGGDE